MTIEARSSQGDKEGLVLPQVSPGRFRLTSTKICWQPFAPIVGDGWININTTVLPATVTFVYVDANPGANRPQATLMRRIRIQ